MQCELFGVALLYHYVLVGNFLSFFMMYVHTFPTKVQSGKYMYTNMFTCVYRSTSIEIVSTKISCCDSRTVRTV